MKLIEAARCGYTSVIDEQPLGRRFRAATKAAEHDHEQFTLQVLEGAWSYLPHATYEQLFEVSLEHQHDRLFERLLGDDVECDRPTMSFYSDLVEDWIQQGRQGPAKMLQRHSVLEDQCIEGTAQLVSNWGTKLIRANIFELEKITSLLQSVTGMDEDERAEAAREVNRTVHAPTDTFDLPDSGGVDSRFEAYRNLLEQYDLSPGEMTLTGLIRAGDREALRALEEAAPSVLHDRPVLAYCVDYGQVELYEFVEGKAYADDDPFVRARYALQSEQKEMLNEAINELSTDRLGRLLMGCLASGDDVAGQQAECLIAAVKQSSRSVQSVCREALFNLFDRESFTIDSYEPYFAFFKDHLPLDEQLRKREGYEEFLAELMESMNVELVDRCMELLPLTDEDKAWLLGCAGSLGRFVDDRAQVTNYLFDQGAEPTEPAFFKTVAVRSPSPVRKQWLQFYAQRERIDELPDFLEIVREVFDDGQTPGVIDHYAQSIFDDSAAPLHELLGQLCDYDLTPERPSEAQRLLYDQRNEHNELQCERAMLELAERGFKPSLKLMRTIRDDDRQFFDNMAEHLNGRETRALQTHGKEEV